MSPSAAELEQPTGSAIAADLAAWYVEASRRLPWRDTADPYAIWISEAMLQQTQVATVVPYWRRWMQRFPTVDALAAASLTDVLTMWQGLGYYARARNLHAAAQQISEKWSGSFPDSFADVLALPGVGRYTAGAVCSIAFGTAVPVVDANVTRVLTRLFAMRGDPRSRDSTAKQWSIAADLLPSKDAGRHNQAMMELGALVCTDRPKCGNCPLQRHCMAHALRLTDSLPEYGVRPEYTRRRDVAALVYYPQDRSRILLVRRPDGGLWGGLWEAPRVTALDGECDDDAAVRAARETAGVEVTSSGALTAPLRHGVTTIRITLVGVVCRIVKETSLARDDLAWAARTDVGERYPVSSPQRRLLASVFSNPAHSAIIS